MNYYNAVRDLWVLFSEIVIYLFIPSTSLDIVKYFTERAGIRLT